MDVSHPDKWPASIELKMKSGEVYRGRADFAKGDPENPAERELLIEKYRDLTVGSWDVERAEAFEKMALNLDSVKNVRNSVSKMIKLN